MESKFFNDWEVAFSNWIESRRYADVANAKQAFLYLQTYWSDHLILLEPELFFSAHLKRESLLEWASKPNLTISSAKKLKLVNQFIRAFVASTPFFAIPDEFDEEIFLKDCYAWPISNSDLSVISNKLGEEGRNGKSNNVSLPEHLIRQIEIILTENDMNWPKKRTGDWITVPASHNSPTKRVYCPVLPNMILILLKLPLRGVQIRRLDSGEGDDYTYDIQNRQFIPNPSQHCGYWTRQSDVRNCRRGVLRKFVDSAVQQEFCGFYINSNKTQDRKVLFDENSGYEIFWEFDEVIEIILKTRKWQETYNAVLGPIDFGDLPATVFAEPSDTVKLKKPACFYLFRYPCGNKPNCEAPPTSQVLRNFWYETLAELERRLATEMDSPPILIDRWDGKVPMSSPYHVHGLRLGGLTRLAKVGVSPWILQNVVGGHANWVMTAFYIKPGFGFITAHLNERYIQAMQNSQKEFAQFLTEATIENVHRMALINNPRAEAGLLAVRAHKSAYLMATLENGICPNCQTLCDEGFEIIQWLDYKPKELQKNTDPFRY
ncbi:VPA1269 family protein [Paraburkholderia sp. MM5477-R1]|uniref:VPA1269 family protein n=1 Tax=Paraburkholderia sp. MM5477-R1 TaxID=2991062 RepID=UPI003D1B1576